MNISVPTTLTPELALERYTDEERKLGAEAILRSFQEACGVQARLEEIVRDVRTKIAEFNSAVQKSARSPCGTPANVLLEV